MLSLVADREALVAALREHGVDWLAPSDALAGRPLAPAELLASLAGHPDARLRQALSALFLLRPRLAEWVPGLRGQLPEAAWRELLAHYMAAVYLQQMWRVRLGHYLPPAAGLPDYFSAELGLPSPADEHGQAGLAALADWQAGHSPHRLNFLSAYEGTAELLFQSLKLKRPTNEFAATG